MIVMKHLIALLLAVASCACSGEPELGRVCGTVEAKFRAAIKGAALEQKPGIAAATWKAQSIDPLASAIASEGRNWIATGEGRHQLSALALQYKDEASALAIATKLSAQGQALKGSKILTRFRAVSKGKIVLIVFTESALSEPALATIQQLDSSWIGGN